MGATTHLLANRSFGRGIHTPLCHVSNTRATQGGSRHTWRLRGASAGWCRRLPAPKAGTCARSRPSTREVLPIVALLWNEPHFWYSPKGRPQRQLEPVFATSLALGFPTPFSDMTFSGTHTEPWSVFATMSRIGSHWLRRCCGSPTSHLTRQRDYRPARAARGREAAARSY